MFKKVCRTLIITAAVLAAATLRAQDPDQRRENLPATVNVFLDCEFCDFNFIRDEVPYVNWVRDRAVSDVHLLMTRQRTGGGGYETILTFIGQRGFAQTVDTLKSVSSGNATQDDQRKAYTRTIKTGLVPFLARTAVADRLTVSVSSPAPNAPATAADHDRWRAWVMTVSASGFTFGEKTYQYYNGRFTSEAKRVTNAWKSAMGGDFSYNETAQLVENGNFDQTADTTFYTFRRRWNSYATQLKAIDQHFSAGITGNLGADSYNNQNHYAKVKVAGEYNLFPYKESSRRQLRVQYGAGLASYDYKETTIYDKDEETVPIHYASIAASATQPWGSLFGELEHNALLLAPSKRNTEVFASGSVRIIKGLTVEIGGSYSWIHDQLYLPKGNASKESVLLRQQALQTSYSYDFNFGLRYTFGSIFNNVVFPRFGGSNSF